MRETTNPKVFAPACQRPEKRKFAGGIVSRTVGVVVGGSTGTLQGWANYASLRVSATLVAIGPTPTFAPDTMRYRMQ